MPKVYLGLGSNLANPVLQVKQALNRLGNIPQTKLICNSALYQTAPLGNLPQPDYINAVAELETDLSPLILLACVQLLENLQGRTRNQYHGARTLDIDILLYGQQEFQYPQLSIPHPRLYERNFVLYPLYECNPQLILPNGVSLSTIAKLNRIPKYESYDATSDSAFQASIPENSLSDCL